MAFFLRDAGCKKNRNRSLNSDILARTGGDGRGLAQVVQPITFDPKDGSADGSESTIARQP
jgi:hypothetical protein